MKPISYYGLLLLRSKSNATSSTLLYPCRIAGSFIAHTTTSGTSSQQLVIFFQIMETSSGLYKVYTAKRLLQNRTVHWLIGEKLKKKESKPILRLCRNLNQMNYHFTKYIQNKNICTNLKWKDNAVYHTYVLS